MKTKIFCVFTAIGRFFVTIFEETPEEKEAREKRDALMKECQDFFYGRKTFSDEYLKELRERVRMEKINYIYSAPFYSHNGYPNSLSFFDFSGKTFWDEYMEQIEEVMKERGLPV